MYLKTVKHLLRMFSSLGPGQLEISPSKKDNIYARKSHYRQKDFSKVQSEKKNKNVLKENVESDEELVCWTSYQSNAPLNNQLKFP